MGNRKRIKIQYFAMLREMSGCSEETLDTASESVEEFYEEVKRKHNFTYPKNVVKLAINNEFRDWQYLLRDGDTVVFIPPVSGGA